MTPWDQSEETDNGFRSPDFSPALLDAPHVDVDGESSNDRLETPEAENQQEQPTPDIPLEYRGYWSAGKPHDGTVKPAVLAELLARSRISAGTSARILAEAGVKTGHIKEQAFYNALGQAAAIQNGDIAGYDLHVASSSSSPSRRPTNPNNQIKSYAPLSLKPVVISSDASGNDYGIPNSGSIASQLSTPKTHFETDTNNVRVMARDKLEGSFMFRHVVYVVDGSFNGVGIRVIRRFRDFVWLLDRLVAKYPFRILPTLPPKKVGVSGRFLTGDREFTKHRQNGLMRFANILVNHPVVGQDELTKAFFTSQSQGDTLQVRFSGSDNTGNRAQFSDVTSIDSGAPEPNASIAPANSSRKGTELEQMQLDPLFVARFDEGEYEQRLEAFRSATGALLTETIKIAGCMDRDLKRRAASAADALNMAYAAESMSKLVPTAYGDTGSDTHNVIDALKGAIQFGQDSADVLQLSIDALKESAFEEIKRFRDMLRAAQEMLSRLQLQGGNTIIKVERRIESLKAQLAEAGKREGVREEELAKLQDRIDRNQADMLEQVTRDWLIKRVVGEEIERAHSHIAQLSSVLQKMARESVKHQELAAEAALKFDKHVECLRR